MILYISRLFSRLTLKMNGSRGTYVNIEKICFYLFTIRFTLYVLFFLYRRFSMIVTIFFFLLFFFVNCIQFLDVGEVCVEISFHSGQ